MTFINWNSLRNPVFQHENWSVKDACMAYEDGFFFLSFSAFYRDRVRTRSHLAAVTTKDWKHFSKPLFNMRGKGDGWTGLCSPNITKIGDLWYLTFNSWGNRHKNRRTNDLFYMTSRDLMHWSDRKQIARNLTEDIRTIDIAIAYENNKFYAIWKDRDHKRVKKTDRARIATCESLDGDFKYINNGYMKFYDRTGNEPKQTHENFEFIKIDGTWYLLTTDYRPHRPHLYKIGGDGYGAHDTDWLRWEEGYEIKIKEQSFNTHHLSNAAFLADWREYDGYFYLIYAGNTEGRSHARRGDNKLGLARSKSLENFMVLATGHTK